MIATLAVENYRSLRRLIVPLTPFTVVTPRPQRAGAQASTIELIKDFGETRVAGREPLDGPAWRWPKR